MKDTSIYVTIFHALPEAIIICDEILNIIDINYVGQQLCGCAAEDYKGRSLHNLIVLKNDKLSSDSLIEAQIATPLGFRNIELSVVQAPKPVGQYYVCSIREAVIDCKKEQKPVADSIAECPVDIVHSLERYLWEFDLDGTNIFLSDRISDILGYYPAELIGKPVYQILTASSKTEFLRLMEEARYNPSVFKNFIFQAISKNGQVVWLSNNGIPKYNKDKKLTGFRGTTLDITTDKIIDDALAQSEEQFQQIVNAMAEGLLILSQEKKIIAANRQAEKLFGVTFEQMNGKSTLEPEIQFLREDGTVFSAEDCPGIITLLTGKSCNNVIMGLRKRAGNITWILVNAEGIGGLENALPQRVIITFNDITSLINTERALSRANERLQNILSSLDLLFWSKDMYKDNLYLLSKGCQDVFGFEPKEFLNNPDMWRQIIHPDDVCIFENLNAENLAGNVGVNDYRIYHRSGELRWIRDYRIPAIGPNGKIERIDGMIMEITARKLQEEELKAAKSAAEDASEAKSNFLATISHEIRTPLNGIIGMTEILQKTSMDARQQECLAAITNSADLLLAIINDVLDLSKIEAGKMEIETVPFQLMSLIHDIEGLCRTKLNAEQVQMSVQIDAALAGIFMGDVNRISQVLLNLVSNAVKFTWEGKIDVDVWKEFETPEYVRVKFQVSDTGIGIPKEMHESLFRPFQQADGSTSRRFGGTGLGLAISKRLVELMEGTIGFSSIPAKGSIFWFSVPVKKGNKNQMFLQKNMDAKTSFHSQNLLVLVVEDNPVNQQVAQAQLEAVGASVHIAADGQEAITLFDKYRYDLIFMDCHMPDMDGFETTRFIRLREGQARKTPIIAMTALAMTGDFERCIEAGMDDYITKPVKLNLLYGIMKRHLKMIL